MKTTEQLIIEAENVIFRLFEQGYPVVIAFSGGKDSSVVANLALRAARKALTAGHKPFILAMTSCTLVENPEIVEHFINDLVKMQMYAEEAGFELETKIVTPKLAATWQVNVLSGRSLPSFAGDQAKCSQDMKVDPQEAFKREMFFDLSGRFEIEPVTLLGTRFDESAKRSSNMTSRGDSAVDLVRNKAGYLNLSPIAEWTTDDVWDALLASFGDDSYSDFEDTLRIYKDAAAGECVLNADAKRAKGGCGARTGCWTCQMTEDKSLTSMVESDPRYAYARGLIKLNQFLRATRYDFDRRNWIGKDSSGGYTSFQPEGYSADMLREMTRYMLQLDHDEIERAAMAGERLKFTLIDTKMLIAIDAMWSLNGYHPPFAAWADYRDIFERGVRYDVPAVDIVPPQELPETRFIHVGNEPDEPFYGLRDEFIEAMLESPGQSVALKEGAGFPRWNIKGGDAFDINEESAELIKMFELDSMCRKYDAAMIHKTPGIGVAYKYYLMYGALELQSAQPAHHDRMLRRAQWRRDIGLSGIDHKMQRLMSVEYSEMPEDAKMAWGKKDPVMIAAKKELKKTISDLKAIGKKFAANDREKLDAIKSSAEQMAAGSKFADLPAIIQGAWGDQDPMAVLAQRKSRREIRIKRTM